MIDMLSALSEHGLSDLTPRRSRPAGWMRAANHRHKVSAKVDLLPTIDRSVIPLLHAALQKDLQRPPHHLISPEAAQREDVAEFAERMLGGTLEGAYERIDELRLAGRTLESIYLKLLAPAACHLRDLWRNDYCGLADMTFALCNLQSALRHYAQDFYAETTRPDLGSRVLVVASSGDGVDLLTPMFGLMLMSQFFRRDGWDAAIERDLTCPALGQTVGEWFDMVEVVAAGDAHLDDIASGIRAIRRGSPNPSIGVIVCGQIFCDRPEYIGLVGADLMASDPLSSLSQAQSFVTRQTQSRRLS